MAMPNAKSSPLTNVRCGPAPRFSAARPRLVWLRLAAALLLLLVAAGEARAGLNSEACVSNDHTVYMVLKTNVTRTRVTSVALSQDAANSCVENSAEPVQTAVAVGGPILPSAKRTAVLANFTTNANLVGTCTPPQFDPAAAGGAGILVLPGGVKVSANPTHADCGGTCVAIKAVGTSDASVPAAYEISVSRFAMSGVTSCTVQGNTLVFPSPASPLPPVVSDGRTSSLDPTDTGEVTDQQVTLDDTNGTVVGNPASQATPDGFVLRGSCTGSASPDCQLIVFMGTATGTGFGKGAAGFVTDVNDVQTDTDGFGNNQQLPGHEICDDKIDNDGDRLADCADPDCLGAQSCTSTGPAASPAGLAGLALLLLAAGLFRLKKASCQKAGC